MAEKLFRYGSPSSAERFEASSASSFGEILRGRESWGAVECWREAFAILMRISTTAARDRFSSFFAEAAHFSERAAAACAAATVFFISFIFMSLLAWDSVSSRDFIILPLSGILGLFVRPADISFTGLNFPSGSFSIRQRGDIDLSFPSEIFLKASAEYLASTAIPSPSPNMRDIFPTGRAFERGDSSGWPTKIGIPQPTRVENLAALFIFSSDFSSTSCIPSLWGHSP